MVAAKHRRAPVQMTTDDAAGERYIPHSALEVLADHPHPHHLHTLFHTLSVSATTALSVRPAEHTAFTSAAATRR